MKTQTMTLRLLSKKGEESLFSKIFCIFRKKLSMANTDKLAPFSQNESSVALLNLLLNREGFSRKTMYLLEILNTLTQNGTPIFKRTPPETLRGLSEGGRKNVAASFIARAGNCSDRTDQEEVGGEQSQGLFLQWDEVERNLQEWALKEGCWFPDADNNLAKIYNDKIGEGAEAKVYYSAPDVIKTIGCRFNPQEMLDRIAITNFLFPETRLELIGLGRREDGEFCFVVKQPFIKGEYVQDETVHLDMLEDFRPDPDGLYAGFVNDRYVLSDLHDRNILRSPDGNLFIIDCNVRLNTPEIGKGGKWEIPPVEFSEGEVLAAAEALNGLLPKTVSRRWLEENFGDNENRLEEQLAMTGRYNGFLTLPTKSGGTIDICVEVNPDDEETLLWSSVDTVKTLVANATGFSPDEKKMLQYGYGVFKGDSFVSFSLDKGRLDAATNYEMARRKHLREQNEDSIKRTLNQGQKKSIKSGRGI